jgi:hypothetical protein
MDIIERYLILFRLRTEASSFRNVVVFRIRTIDKVQRLCNPEYYTEYTVAYRVGIATSYGLDDGGVGVQVPVRVRFLTSPNRPD